jgi:pSer/pThr/pTyr-binding forkhead associated (FHA) protein
MKLSLLVLTAGKQEGKVLEIKLPQFLVGRDPQCHLRPASPLISKRHCALIQKDGKVFVRDFGSTNGTFVNDEQVDGERELKDGDQLKIGPIHFAIRLEVEPSTRTPVPPTKTPTKVAPVTPAPATSADTPAPPTAAKPKPASAEDDIAAMLLSLDDGTSATTGDIVPEGSTVFDLQAQQDPNAPAKPEVKDDKKKPTASGDTRSAAASILEKMMKRPRTPS